MCAAGQRVVTVFVNVMDNPSDVIWALTEMSTSACTATTAAAATAAATVTGSATARRRSSLSSLLSLMGVAVGGGADGATAASTGSEAISASAAAEAGLAMLSRSRQQQRHQHRESRGLGTTYESAQGRRQVLVLATGATQSSGVLLTGGNGPSTSGSGRGVQLQMFCQCPLKASAVADKSPFHLLKHPLTNRNQIPVTLHHALQHFVSWSCRDVVYLFPASPSPIGR